MLKMTPITKLLAAVFLLCVSQLCGQPLTTSFSPATLQAPVGATVDLQLKVTDFTKILTCQFPITFNAAVLQYQSADGFGLPSMGNANVSYQSSPVPKIGVSYEAHPINFPTGVTVPAGTSILTLHFKVIANGMATVNLAPGIQPVIDVVRDPGNSVTVNYQNGGAVVTGGTGNPPPPPVVGFAIVVGTNGVVDSVPQNQNFCTPISVNDFDDIESMQFNMHFDPAKLAFTGVQNFGLFGLDASQIIVNSGTGLVTFGWASPGELINGQYDFGVTLPDGAVIFEMCFNALGTPNTTTQITVDGNGLQYGAEAIKTGMGNVWTAQSGHAGTFFFIPVVDPAALTITIDTATVLAGEIKCLDVKVKNFTSIDQVQLPIQWDNTKLEFQNVIIPAAPNNLLGLSQNSTISWPPTTPTGRIKLTWYDTSPNGLGLTVPDGTVIFSICFKGLAPVGTTVPVEIKQFTEASGNVFVVECFKNGSSVPINPNLNHGYLRIVSVPPCAVSANLDTKTDPKCFNGSTGAINVTTSGSGTLSYSWTGPNSFSASTKNISTLKAGTYNLTVTSTAGCTTTLAVTLNNPPALTASGTGTSVSCFGKSDGSIILTTGGGTGGLTYAWAGPGGNLPSVIAQNPTGLVAGNYTTTVTDANQCTLVSSLILVPTPGPININNLTITQIPCFGGTGSINFTNDGGTPSYSYAWSGPGAGIPNAPPPQTNLIAGIYQVTITDSKGCTKVSQTMPLTAPPSLVVQQDAVTNVKCFGDNNGAISITIIGGTPPLKSIVWKNASGQQVSSQEDPSGLPAGTYNVTVIDKNDCTATLFQSITIATPSSALIVPTPTTTNVTCPGGNDGSINLNISGGWVGYSVVWSPQISPVANPTGLSANTYTATITDAQGCTTTQSAKIEAPSAITLQNTTITHLDCFNSGDGAITIVVGGGTQPFKSITWSPGGLAGSTISNLAAGFYTPSITDLNQCTQVFPAIPVNAPDPVNASGVVMDASGATNGTITLSPTGGTAGYTFNWSNGSTSNPLNAPAGDYTVTITDSKLCQLTQSYTIKQTFIAFLPTITNPGTPTCVGASTGCFTVNLPSGTIALQKPVKIDWSGTASGTKTSGDDATPICDLAGGNYSFTITAANGQSLTLSNQTIPNHQPVTHNSGFNHPNEDFTNGNIDLTGIFGSTYTYNWNWFENGNLQTATSQDLVDLDSGTYKVTITDVLTGCTTTDMFVLNRKWQPLLPIPGSLDIKHPTCKDSKDGHIKVAYFGGNPPFHYKWTASNAQVLGDTSKITNLPAATYSLTVTDENGTTVSGSWTLKPISTITGLATVSPGPNGYDVSGPTSCDGEVKATATGQSGTLNFTWNDGAKTATNSALCKGDWWVIVADAVGCSDTLNGTLIAPPAVVFGINISNYNGFSVRCHGGNDGEAAVVVSGGVPPYQCVWSTGFTQTIASASGITRQEALAAGTYSLTVTDANDIKSVQEIVLTEPDPFVVDTLQNLPSTFTECNGTFIFTANGAEPIKFDWVSQISAGKSDSVPDLCANEKVSVLATDANGCRSTWEGRMGYPGDGCLIFRPVLTPGQTEGKNDDLFVTCIEAIADNSLEIYNRWGQLVYETENYDNDSKVWKGTNSKDQPLPEGVYYYILTYKDSRDTPQQVKGYVNLLR